MGEQQLSSVGELWGMVQNGPQRHPDLRQGKEAGVSITSSLLVLELLRAPLLWHFWTGVLLQLGQEPQQLLAGGGEWEGDLGGPRSSCYRCL